MGWGPKHAAAPAAVPVDAPVVKTGGGGWGPKRKPQVPNTASSAKNTDSLLLPAPTGFSNNMSSNPISEETEKSTPYGMALISILAATPALLGSWCWPLLMAGFFSGAFSGVNSDSSRALAHTLTFAMNLAIFTNMMQFMYRACKERKNFTSFKLMSAATILILVDETRHIVMDAGYDSMFGVSLAMFNDDGSLSPVGLFGTCCTWVGVFCMLAALYIHIVKG